MDRRAALKKLAAGGALSIGGTAIVSQPAFAFAAPVVTGSPTFDVITAGVRSARIVITNIPTASCPASAESSTGPTEVSLSWRAIWPGGGPGGSDVVMNSGSGPLVTIPVNFSQWIPNDRIVIAVTYRYCCVYPGGTTCICVQWIREFVAAGFGSNAVWSIVPGGSSGPTTVPCPSNLGAPLAAPFSTPSPVIGRDADGNPIFDEPGATVPVDDDVSDDDVSSDDVSP